MARGRKRHRGRGAPQLLERAPERALEADERYLAFCRETICLDWVEEAEHLREVVAHIQEAAAAGRLQALGLDYEVAMSRARNHWTDALRTVQIAYDAPLLGRRQFVVDCHAVDASPLRTLLTDPRLEKIVHHAAFEQSWSISRFGAEIDPLYDTIEAMKEVQHRLAEMSERDRLRTMARLGIDWKPHAPPFRWKDMYFGRNTLQETAARLLGLYLPKENQLSDWGNERLSASQVTYAAIDAAVLLPIAAQLKRLTRELGIDGRVQRRIRSANARTRAKVEHELLTGRQRDESGRVLAALERASTRAELERCWEAARSVALTATSYLALKRFYERRRALLRELEESESSLRALAWEGALRAP